MMKLFHQSVKNDIRTYENIKKLLLVKEMITQPVGCLLYYHYFKENYKLIATDLSKAPDANPKAIQQIILLKI